MNNYLKAMTVGLATTFAADLSAQEAPLGVNIQTDVPPIEVSQQTEQQAQTMVEASSDERETLGPDIVSPSGAIEIPKDTPVHLMVLNEVSTKAHGVGHRFKLRVNKPIIIDGEIVIPVGATGWGEVTSAERSGNLGKSGKLQAKLLYVEVGNTNVAIDGETADKGNSGTGETVLGVIGLGLFGLFAKGNNAKIKAGEMMTAFTTEDTILADSDAE